MILFIEEFDWIDLKKGIGEWPTFEVESDSDSKGTRTPPIRIQDQLLFNN